MPVYAYRDEAGHEWEAVRSIADGATAECPTCALVGKRVPPSTAPAAHFRGRGWTPHHYPGRSGK